MMKIKKKHFKKAFSIIELIFVIAVVGIIAAVAVPKLLDSRTSAIVTTVKQDINTITSSIQSYYMLNNSITKISEAVNINTSTWNVSDTSVWFPKDATSATDACVSISVSTTELTLEINGAKSTVCQKIVDTGVSDATYNLQ